MRKLIFAAILAVTNPAFADTLVWQSKNPTGWVLKGKQLENRSPCYATIRRRADGSRYRTAQECPSAPGLSSIGVPTGGCVIRAACNREANAVKVVGGRIVLYRK